KRSPLTRNRLLVCLSHATSPHPQALSGTHSPGDVCTLRAGGQGAGELALACPSCKGEDSAIVRAEGNAALHQALSSPSADLSGGALSLAQRTGCGALSSADARLCLCRKWKDHAALSMDGCILEATGKWEQGRRTRTRCCLALP